MLSNISVHEVNKTSKMIKLIRYNNSINVKLDQNKIHLLLDNR